MSAMIYTYTTGFAHYVRLFARSIIFSLTFEVYPEGLSFPFGWALLLKVSLFPGIVRSLCPLLDLFVFVLWD
jgi:hypothetical protein